MTEPRGYTLCYHMHEYKRRGYLLENFRLFHQRSKGLRVDYHYHEFCKLLLLLSGSGDYVVDGQRYHLQEGDVVLVGCDSVHRPELTENVDYDRVIIYIDPGFLQQESSDKCDLTACFNSEQGHVLRPNKMQYQNIVSITARLEQELAQNSYGHEIVGKALLLELLVHLRRYQQQESILYPAPVQPKNDRILDVLRYMEQHLCDDLEIDHLAEKFFISKYHLMRLFHKETGSTIHAYLTQRRLLLAKDLIKQGCSATDACYRAGFHSYSSFTRAYGKHFGSTPTGKKDPSIVKNPGYE